MRRSWRHLVPCMTLHALIFLSRLVFWILLPTPSTSSLVCMPFNFKRNSTSMPSSLQQSCNILRLKAGYTRRARTSLRWCDPRWSFVEEEMAEYGHCMYPMCALALVLISSIFQDSWKEQSGQFAQGCIDTFGMEVLDFAPPNCFSAIALHRPFPICIPEATSRWFEAMEQFSSSRLCNCLSSPQAQPDNGIIVSRRCVPTCCDKWLPLEEIGCKDHHRLWRWAWQPFHLFGFNVSTVVRSATYNRLDRCLFVSLPKCCFIIQDLREAVLDAQTNIERKMPAAVKEGRIIAETHNLFEPQPRTSQDGIFIFRYIL